MDLRDVRGARRISFSASDPSIFDASVFSDSAVEAPSAAGLVSNFVIGRNRCAARHPGRDPARGFEAICGQRDELGRPSDVRIVLLASWFDRTRPPESADESKPSS
jgi:hypothetical protein